MDEALYNLYLKVSKNIGLSSCGKKYKYSSEVLAKEGAKRLTQELGEKKDYYPCYFCGKWHVGRKMSFRELLEHSRA